MDLWTPLSLKRGPFGAPGTTVLTPPHLCCSICPPAPSNHNFIFVPNMKTRHTYLFWSRVKTRTVVTVKSRRSGSKLIIGTVSVVSLSDTKSILLISDKYRLPIPSGRLSAILSELYFGACQTAGNKTHFITVTCSVFFFFFAAPTRVHKLLGPALRATLFDNGAKEENPLISGGLCCWRLKIMGVVVILNPTVSSFFFSVLFSPIFKKPKGFSFF